ncbi:MAG: hypothetical protein ACN6O1_07575 [Comamonas sp.]|uniref:hypothetical protein n=1 Tax=Comamonas sp. TaxID=34028 RepID=UPI003D097756
MQTLGCYMQRRSQIPSGLLYLRPETPSLTAYGRFFNARGRPVAIDTVQPSLDVHLVAQCGYFGIPSPKIASEVCDHAEPFCKLAVEGCGIICKIAAGSGVGFGLRAISVGSAVGVAAQALSTGKLNAHIS